MPQWGFIDKIDYSPGEDKDNPEEDEKLGKLRHSQNSWKQPYGLYVTKWNLACANAIMDKRRQ